jgi:hypothetical protein
VSYAAITLCVASRLVFIVVSVHFVMTQSGNFWIHPPMPLHWTFCVRQNTEAFDVTIKQRKAPMSVTRLLLENKA